ncbi:MAG: 2-phospho-L-lactate guanylyltransferase [Polyangia bacterium]
MAAAPRPDEPTLRPLWVVLPVKGFARAKSRLSPVLAGPERAALAQKLCEHVLSTLAGCDGVDGVLVLSDSDEVLELAARYGRTGEREPEGEGNPRAEPERPLLGALVDAGLARVHQHGARAALILMSDLPRIDAADLSRLVALLREHDCVIAPDLREQNTNALALRLAPEHSLQTAFGTGDSFRLHLELARARGLRTTVHRSIGLGFDVDLPEDYAELAGPVGLLRRSGMNR